MFGGRDTRDTCRVVVVNAVTAASWFDNDAVGRVMEDETGQRVEIVGVVTPKEATPIRRRVWNPRFTTMPNKARSISVSMRRSDSASRSSLRAAPKCSISVSYQRLTSPRWGSHTVPARCFQIRLQPGPVGLV
jgi:hypothetical protein